MPTSCRFCRRLTVFLVASLAILGACGQDEPGPQTAAGVPAPAPDDPVTEWELQYLPTIDQHMQAGRLDSVIYVCQQGLREDSTRIVLYNLMASAYAGQKRYEAATAALETAVRLSPAFTAAWVNLGGIQMRQGHIEKAIPYLEEAARLDAQSAAAHRRLAEAYLRSGRHEQAATQIRAALDLSPNDATLHFLLGESLEGLDSAAVALAAFSRAGVLDPGFGATHARAESLARRLRDTALADSLAQVQAHLQQIADGDTTALDTRRQLRHAVTNAPEDAIHQARLGGFYLYYGYLPEAMALFARAAELEPRNAWLFNEFGGLLSQQGHGPEALHYYQKALEVQPDMGPALLNTGGILNAMKRHEEALGYLLRAQAQAPDDAGVRFYVGVTYMSLGQNDQARRVLTEARALTGDKDEALRQQIEAALASISGDAEG